MTMFQRKRIKEIQEAMEAAATPLEEKADSIWTKLGNLKWTWAIALGVCLLAAIGAFNLVF